MLFYLRKNPTASNHFRCRTIYKGKGGLWLKGGDGNLWDLMSPPFKIMYQLKIKRVL